MNIEPMGMVRKLPSGAIFGAMALVGALFLWQAYSLGRSQATYDLQDQSYAKRQAADSGPRIQRECAALRGPVFAKCADEIIDARDQRDSNESNLIAQRKVADGTTRFLVLGAFELALTLWGILVFRDQLAATRDAVAKTIEANGIARDSAHRQLRPYLYLSDINMTVERFTSGFGDKAPIVLYFKNFGQTPAKHCTLKAEVFLGDEWNRPFDHSFDDCTIVRLGDMPPGHVRDRDGYTVTGLKEEWASIALGTRSIFVCGLIEYDDGSDRGPYKTEFRWASSDDDFIKTKFSPTPLGNESD